MRRRVLFRECLVSLLQRAPRERAGRVNPPIMRAIILAMGMRMSAGRNMIACARGGMMSIRAMNVVNKPIVLLFELNNRIVEL